MKRFLVSLAVVSLAMVPIAASAATLASGQQYSLPVQQTIDGNAYVAAGMATFGGHVTGDLVVAGGTVSLAGSVGGDVLAAGGTVEVLGPVSGDVRAIGGAVSLNDRVGGEVMVAGGTVHVLPSAVVQGDLNVAGGNVVIDGTVQGAVHMVGGQLTINGAVVGDVSVRANKPIVMGSEASVYGKVSFTQMGNGSAANTHTGVPQRMLLVALGVLSGIKLLGFLGLAVLLIWLWRKPTLEVLSQMHDSFWPSLGRGLVYGILVPIAAVLLLISFVGMYVGIILLAAYAILIVLASVMAGMFTGSWLAKVFKKKTALHLTWWSGLLGVVVFAFLAFIPVVGWLIVLILCTAVFGALAHSVQRWLFSR